MNYYIDYSISHGVSWKEHKYIRKEGNRYIYPEDLKGKKYSSFARLVGKDKRDMQVALNNQAASAKQNEAIARMNNGLAIRESISAKSSYRANKPDVNSLKEKADKTKKKYEKVSLKLSNLNSFINNHPKLYSALKDNINEAFGNDTIASVKYWEKQNGIDSTAYAKAYVEDKKMRQRIEDTTAKSVSSSTELRRAQAVKSFHDKAAEDYYNDVYSKTLMAKYENAISVFKRAKERRMNKRIKKHNKPDRKNRNNT